MLYHRVAKTHISTSEVLVKYVHFDLRLAKISYTALFLGNQLGKILEKMSVAKSAPEGLKDIKCKHGIGRQELPHPLCSQARSNSGCD
jgi:hypothetical protein